MEVLIIRPIIHCLTCNHSTTYGGSGVWLKAAPLTFIGLAVVFFIAGVLPNWYYSDKLRDKVARAAPPVKASANAEIRGAL